MPVDMQKNNSQFCSLCLRSREETGRLVQASGIKICRSCIDKCQNIFLSAEQEEKKGQHILHTPKELHRLLDEFVIGQENAKKIISVAVYNHYKRLNNNQDSSSVEIEKSNILAIGPTGSGKTLLAKTLARILDVPFAIADATTLTEAGYVGSDVETVIKSLLSKCDNDINKAQRGIIFLDEIDKISRRSDNPSITRDVSGEGVQQAMLKLIEGTIASVATGGGKNKHPNSQTVDVDTSNILFICGGAFDGLEKIIQKRLNTKNSIGFSAKVNTDKDNNLSELFAQLQPEDLIKYGLIPELVGRLAVHLSLSELDEKALVNILIKPKNAIVKQFQAFFAMENIKLEIRPQALTAIAKLAVKRKTGARGLRSILENILLDLMYNVPSQNDVNKIIIDKSVIEGTSEPLIIRKQKSAA